MNPKEFGTYLRSLRKEANLTMRKLDSLSGVSHSYISQLERGERGIPSPDILKKLAEPLGVEYGELMYEAGYLTGESKVTLDEDLTFNRIVVNGKVLRGEDAFAYMRSEGLIFESEEDAVEAHRRSEELEFLHFLNKEVTYFGYGLSKDERIRVVKMMELMFPQYVPQENKD